MYGCGASQQSFLQEETNPSTKNTGPYNQSRLEIVQHTRRECLQQLREIRGGEQICAHVTRYGACADWYRLHDPALDKKRG